MDFLNDWCGRRVLITGGTGFLGRHVAAQGLASGVEVHVLASQSTDAEVSIGYHHVVDLRERERVAVALREIQPAGIIHLAAAGVRQGPCSLADMLAVNVVGLEELLAAAEVLNHRPRIVITGSGYEYAAQDRPLHESDPIIPINAYGVSKAAAYLVAQHHAQRLPIVWGRLFNLYGAGELEPRLVPSIIKHARSGEPVDLTSGAQVCDYTYIADAAEGIWRLLAHPHEPGTLLTLNLASGRATTLRRFVEELADLLAAKGIPPRLNFGARPYRTGEPMTYLADVTALRRTLGWTPPTTTAQGLALTLESTKPDPIRLRTLEIPGVPRATG